MILDLQHRMSNDQEHLTATETASTNVIDFGAAGIAEKDLFLVINVNDAVTRVAGAANVTYLFESDSDSGFATNNITHFTTTLAKATLVAGYNVVKMRLPKNVQRYVRCTYEPSATLDTGSATAFLTMDVDVDNLVNLG